MARASNWFQLPLCLPLMHTALYNNLKAKCHFTLPRFKPFPGLQQLEVKARCVRRTLESLDDLLKAASASFLHSHSHTVQFMPICPGLRLPEQHQACAGEPTVSSSSNVLLVLLFPSLPSHLSETISDISSSHVLSPHYGDFTLPSSCTYVYGFSVTL